MTEEDETNLKEDDAKVRDDEAHAIRQLIERLVMRFPQVPASAVEETVSAVHQEFDQARVRAFVPLLIEHDVLIELKEIAGRADLDMASAETERPGVALGGQT